jgi:hypothetical protein
MNKFNAVSMVREIRDRQYEETKSMKPKEFKKYCEEKAKWAFEQKKAPTPAKTEK